MKSPCAECDDGCPNFLPNGARVVDEGKDPIQPLLNVDDQDAPERAIDADPIHNARVRERQVGRNGNKETGQIMRPITIMDITYKNRDVETLSNAH